MSHAMGVKCPRCQTKILPEWCPEGCAEGHGSTYTTCLACRMASGHAPVESLLTTVDAVTVPTPRDTGPALDPRAVEAAAEALRRDRWPGSYTGEPYTLEADAADLADAVAALTAAAPFLRAEGAAEAQRNFDLTLRQTVFAHAYIEKYAPDVLAAERQRIAAAIRAECLRLRHHDMAFRVPAFDHTDGQPSGRVCRYCEAAARIAEADPGTTAPTEGDDRD